MTSEAGPYHKVALEHAVWKLVEVNAVDTVAEAAARCLPNAVRLERDARRYQGLSGHAARRHWLRRCRRSHSLPTEKVCWQQPEGVAWRRRRLCD